MAARKTASKKKEVVAAAPRNSELLKFQIAELRKDKIVYAVESLALSMLALLIFIGAPSVFPEVINPYDPNSLRILQGVILLPFVFWLLVSLLGNLFRTRKIQKLQKKLMSE